MKFSWNFSSSKKYFNHGGGINKNIGIFEYLISMFKFGNKNWYEGYVCIFIISTDELTKKAARQKKFVGLYNQRTQ